MQFENPLIPGRLVRRYKRFLADVVLESGETVVAHCPNTGSMRGCDEPESRVWLSPARDPRRKLAYTWELVETSGEGHMACINTGRANTLVGDLLRTEQGPASLRGYTSHRQEVRYGEERSRIDWLLDGAGDGGAPVWIEVKNVTLGEGGVGYFPDAVTERGQKHLRELCARVAAGDRAVIFFCVSHTGVAEVRPADAIDRRYGELLRHAVHQGVEAMAWQADISPRGMALARELPVRL